VAEAIATVLVVSLSGMLMRGIKVSGGGGGVMVKHGIVTVEEGGGLEARGAGAGAVRREEQRTPRTEEKGKAGRRRSSGGKPSPIKINLPWSAPAKGQRSESAASDSTPVRKTSIHFYDNEEVAKGLDKKDAEELSSTPVVNHDTGEKLDLMALEAMNAQFDVFDGGDGGSPRGGRSSSSPGGDGGLSPTVLAKRFSGGGGGSFADFRSERKESRRSSIMNKLKGAKASLS
jgi:hypothetical protein